MKLGLDRIFLLTIFLSLAPSVVRSKTVTCNGVATTAFGDFVIESFELTPLAETLLRPARPSQRDFYSYRVRIRYRNSTETGYVQPKLLVTFSGTRSLSSITRPKFGPVSVEVVVGGPGVQITPGSRGTSDDAESIRLYFDVALNSCDFQLTGAEGRIPGPKEQAEIGERSEREKLVAEEKAKRKAAEEAAQTLRERQQATREALREKEAADQSRRESEDQGNGPGVIETSAFPLYQDPYRYRGKLLWLNPRTWPQLRNGAVVAYQQLPANLLGYTGLIFARMLSETDALFELRAQDVDDPTPALRRVGEIVVQVYGKSGADLRLDRIWHVEGEGVFNGVNGFGTSIKVPLVKFLRYRGDNTAR